LDELPRLSDPGVSEEAARFQNLLNDNVYMESLALNQRNTAWAADLTKELISCQKSINELDKKVVASSHELHLCEGGVINDEFSSTPCGHCIKVGLGESSHLSLKRRSNWLKTLIKNVKKNNIDLTKFIKKVKKDIFDLKFYE
jgi:hypothetical protein